MFNLSKAIVKKIICEEDDLQVLEITLNGITKKAVNYLLFTGSAQIGDDIVVNTTAMDLDLGSGGSDFVYLVTGNESIKNKTAGHIMKLRYTPWQFPVLSVEEDNSTHHEIFNEKTNIDGMPVVVGTLHSQLPAICLTLKDLKPKTKVAYIMTDGAALPLNMSKVVKELKRMKAIDKTVTYGQAFGADHEAVNIFTALLTAKYVCNADIAVVTMGPGITGTNTKTGFTGMEQGQILNAVSALEGQPVAVPRISFADKRDRHYGISHHSITALGLATQVKVDLPLPIIKQEKSIKEKIKEKGLDSKHNVSFHDSSRTLELLKSHMPWITTMGRGIKEEQEFFMAAGAAAYQAIKRL